MMNISSVSLGGRAAPLPISSGRKQNVKARAGRMSVRAELATEGGPYGNGYEPYPLPFGKKRVYVWERPPAGVDASMIFKPRAVPSNHFEQ